RENRGVAADRGAIAHASLDDLPVLGGLQAAVGVDRAGIEVIREHDTVTDKDSVAEGNAFADEGVARDFAVPSDCRARLDFDECADFRPVAYGATVEVHQIGLEYAHIFAQPNVVSDQACPPR